MSTNNIMSTNNSNVTKIVVKYFIGIFFIIITLVFLLLVLYYSTPNNYIIVPNNNDIFKISKQINLKIKSNEKIKINFKDLSDDYIGFDSKTNLIIKNCIKSQNVSMVTDELLKSRFGSDIYVVNFSDEDIDLNINYYNKI
jgi:hypothetical protein